MSNQVKPYNVDPNQSIETFFTISLGKFIKKKIIDKKCVWHIKNKKIESSTNFNDSKDIWLIEDIFKKTKATFTRLTDNFLTKATFTKLLGKINIKKYNN